MTNSVRVSSPSRLHFGLISFGDTTRRQFGGVGVMLSEPRVELLINPSNDFRVVGSGCERAHQFASRWSQASGQKLVCEIHVQQEVPPHIGLGSGTQLGLSVAAGLNEFFGRHSDLVGMATSVNRGLRSAVGSYGFLQGGLIAESGKLPGETLAPLLDRVELPTQWRAVLIRPTDTHGLSGTAETSAFAKLPAVPSGVSQQLESTLIERIVPSAKRHSFEEFSDAVYEYGRLAGECFSTCQGGPYASTFLLEIVDWLREHSVRGVGQSSWGPTLFALVPEHDAAVELVAQLERWRSSKLELQITSFDNSGAQVQHVSSIQNSESS